MMETLTDMKWFLYFQVVLIVLFFFVRWLFIVLFSTLRWLFVVLLIFHMVYVY